MREHGRDPMKPVLRWWCARSGDRWWSTPEGCEHPPDCTQPCSRAPEKKEIILTFYTQSTAKGHHIRAKQNALLPQVKFWFTVYELIPLFMTGKIQIHTYTKKNCLLFNIKHKFTKRFNYSTFHVKNRNCPPKILCWPGVKLHDKKKTDKINKQRTQNETKKRPTQNHQTENVQILIERKKVNTKSTYREHKMNKNKGQAI